MFKKIAIVFILFAFILGTTQPLSYCQTMPMRLPVPGAMVNLSPVFEPSLIKGLTVHKDNPFLFDFIVDTGNGVSLRGTSAAKQSLKIEADRLIKYFFACLTIPEKDLWVNLSPYEKDRMVPQALGQTALGRDLLAEDYILKQLTASLIYPERNLGKEFWETVYAKTSQMYGTVQIPVNTFNKVWIVADKASVYEHGQTAFVVSGHMKVMLEEDYLAMQKHEAVRTQRNHRIASQIIKEIILPEIEKEVNQGQNFAALRQIFNSLILATWYKKNLKEALLNQVYTDRSKVNGVIASQAQESREKIYRQYLKAYKKGVFNYIKEDARPDGQTIPRKYFSGGFNSSLALNVSSDLAMGHQVTLTDNGIFKFTTVLEGINKGLDAAMGTGSVPWSKPTLVAQEFIDSYKNLRNRVAIRTNTLFWVKDPRLAWPDLKSVLSMGGPKYGFIRQEAIFILKEQSRRDLVNSNQDVWNTLAHYALNGTVEAIDSIRLSCYLTLGIVNFERALPLLIHGISRKESSQWVRLEIIKFILHRSNQLERGDIKLMFALLEIVRTASSESGYFSLARAALHNFLDHPEPDVNGLTKEIVVATVKTSSEDKSDFRMRKLVVQMLRKRVDLVNDPEDQEVWQLLYKETSTQIEGSRGIRTSCFKTLYLLDPERAIADGLLYLIDFEFEKDAIIREENIQALQSTVGEEYLFNKNKNIKAVIRSALVGVIKSKDTGRVKGVAEETRQMLDSVSADASAAMVNDKAFGWNDVNSVLDARLNTLKDHPLTPGGIDLNAADMGMTVTKAANGGVKVDFDPAMIAPIKARGIQSAVPIIIGVRPMTDADIRPLLGLLAGIS